MANEIGSTAPYEIAIRVAEISAWDGSPAANAYKPYAIPSETLTRELENREADVMDGMLSARRTNRRQGKKGATGQITHYLRPDCWLALLRMAFGAEATGNPALSQASELQLFNIEIDKGPDIYRAINCRVSRFTLGSEQNAGHLTLVKDIVGADLVPGQSFTATTATLPVGPLIQHYELALLIDGAAVEPISVEFEVNHNLDTDMYRNSQIRRAMKRANKRMVTGAFVLDYNVATKDILAKWHADQEFGFSASWTNGDDVLTLASHTPASAGAQLLGDVPTFNAGGGVTPVRLPFKCYAGAAGDDELVCTIAS